MHVATQFSIFMVNKPGVLAKVLGEFAKAKINIVAMTMMDSAEHGVMRVVFAKPDPARKVLQQLNLPFSETDVLNVTLANKSGALADTAERLSLNHINISYAYVTAGARGGKTTGVFKLADVKKAMRVLQGQEKKAAKKRPVVRRTTGTRR